MRITIKELMRLKNEIAAALSENAKQQNFRTLLGERSDAAYGRLAQNGEEIAPTGRTFPEEYDREINLLRMSEAIHSALAKANVEHGIGDAIRRRENIKRLIALNERAQPKGKPYTRTETRNIAGTGLERVTVEYTPYVTSGDIKGRIRALKRELRELQAHIDAADSKHVEVDGRFDMGELENYLID